MFCVPSNSRKTEAYSSPRYHQIRYIKREPLTEVVTNYAGFEMCKIEQHTLTDRQLMDKIHKEIENFRGICMREKCPTILILGYGFYDFLRTFMEVTEYCGMTIMKFDKEFDFIGVC